MKKWMLYTGLAILYLLHNDLWFWNDGRLVLGLPVGLMYHFVFSIATAFVMYLLVTFAWPEHLEVEDEGAQQR